LQVIVLSPSQSFRQVFGRSGGVNTLGAFELGRPL
jgi:hypothetical protein